MAGETASSAEFAHHGQELFSSACRTSNGQLVSADAVERRVELFERPARAIATTTRAISSASGWARSRKQQWPDRIAATTLSRSAEHDDARRLGSGVAPAGPRGPRPLSAAAIELAEHTVLAYLLVRASLGRSRVWAGPARAEDATPDPNRRPPTETLSRSDGRCPIVLGANL